MAFLAQASFPVSGPGGRTRLATFQLAERAPRKSEIRKPPLPVVTIELRRLDWISKRVFRMRWTGDRLCFDIDKSALLYRCEAVLEWIREELTARKITP